MKRGNKHIPKYTPFLLDVLNSHAFIKMTHSARSLLPYLTAKVKTSPAHPERHRIVFAFSYREARSYRFSNDTIEKALSQLIWFGFIDPVTLGWAYGASRHTSTFRLSERWKLYGTKHHNPIDWKKWKEEYCLGENSQFQKSV